MRGITATWAPKAGVPYLVRASDQGLSQIQENRIELLGAALGDSE